MSHPVEMTEHPLRSPTLSSKQEDLNQEINWKLKILDFAMLVLSHPSMTQAVREMATKELGTATKKTTSLNDPSMPGTSASSTDTPEQPVSTGTPITVSQKGSPTSLTTSWQPPTAGSSRNIQPTSMNTTLSTGRAYMMPSRQVKKNWQDSQKEKAILRRKKEKKKKEEQSEKTSKSPESPSGSGPGQDLWDSPGGDNGLSNKQTEDRIMRNLGWLEYDPMQRDSVRVAYQTDNNTIETCRWVRYELNRTNPHALGTQGMVRPIYEQELHANPCPAPNFSKPRQFCDDALQVFHYNHGSCTLVDRAVTQLGDIGLEAEVTRYQFLMKECDNLALCRQRLDWENLINNDAIIQTGRFLANARGPS